MAKWPKDNQAALIAFYGDPASSVGKNLVKVIPPFRMTYEGKPVPALSFHKLAAPALARALETVWNYYGRDQAKIDALGISKTAGTYNPRFIRGSTTKWSNHAYGAAIDINAEQNGFNVAGNIPIPMIAAFKAEGARWGGDYQGRKDPMHFEFCESGEPARTFEEWLAFYGVKPSGVVPVKPPAPVKPSAPVLTRGLTLQMMEIILGYEGRFQDGKLQVFVVDGQPEIAGITQKDHPAAYARMKALLDAGMQTELRAEVLKYYQEYTEAAASWTDQLGLVFFLRDCILNRGPSGAAEILQMAVHVNVDHQVGEATKRALAALDPAVAISNLRIAREQYEEKKYGKAWRQARGQWQGLVNRWDKAAAQARKFQADGKIKPETGMAGGIVAGGLGTAAAAAQRGYSIGTIIGIVAATVVIAVSAFLIVRAIRKQ